MALGPPPCLTMWRNPRVFGFSGGFSRDSRAAVPEPEERALIVGVLSPVFRSSTASARAAAVLALVARTVRHHQHAALAARRRALPRVVASILQGHVPVKDVLIRGPIVVYLSWIRCGRCSPWRNGGRRHRDRSAFRPSSAIQLQIIRGDKLPTHPPRDVIQHRRNKSNVRVRGDARWLKRRVQQLVDEYFQRHAILQAQR